MTDLKNSKCIHTIAFCKKNSAMSFCCFQRVYDEEVAQEEAGEKENSQPQVRHLPFLRNNDI